MVNILKELELPLKHGIKKYLIDDLPKVGYIVPKEAIETDNPEELIDYLEENLNIQVEPYEFKGIRAEKNLSEIYRKYFPEYDSNSLGKYLEDSEYKDAILLVRADCYNMPFYHNLAFAYEIVENPPGELLQKSSREKKLFSLLVFSPKDYTKYLVCVEKSAPGVRPIAVIRDPQTPISMEEIHQIHEEVENEIKKKSRL